MNQHEAICPDHRLTCTDLVGLNSKKEPVFRCAAPRGTPFHAEPPREPHYFTVSSDAATRLGEEAKKSAKKVKR